MSKGAQTFRPGGATGRTGRPHPASAVSSPGPERFHTSVTERASFRTCRRSWYLEVIAHLQHKDQVQWNLIFGECIHSALEYYYRGNKRDLKAALRAFKRAWTKEDDRLRELYSALYHYGISEEWENYKSKGELMLEYYHTYDQQAAFDWDRVIQVVNVESRLWADILDLDGNHQEGLPLLSGRPDLIVERSDGIWIVDHKTAASPYDARALDIDDQLTGLCYLWWRNTGQVPRGAIYNGLIKDPPKPPRLISEGTKLSQDKSQRTTYDLYLKAIQENGFERADYTEMLEYLHEKGWNQFFVRDGLEFNMEQLESFEKRLYYETEDMKRCVEEPVWAYPNPTQRTCPGCPMIALCQTMEEQGNEEYLREQMYEIAEPRVKIPKEILSTNWKGV